MPKHGVAAPTDATLLPEMMQFLEEFKDVTPDELPRGLPPVRGIEHQIDLVPGASLPNRAAYRASPEETKELQRQVQELLDKGYVRESLSPVCHTGHPCPQKGRVLAHVYGLTGD